jgi:hypothetical protein
MFVFYPLSFLHLQSPPVRPVEEEITRKLATKFDLSMKQEMQDL